MGDDCKRARSDLTANPNKLQLPGLYRGTKAWMGTVQLRPGNGCQRHASPGGAEHRWLLCQQLQPWFSTTWDSLTQTAGYSGRHIGVAVTLSGPGGTCFGRAAWRLPLQILDDEAFCDDMVAMIPEYLEAHPS